MSNTVTGERIENVTITLFNNKTQKVEETITNTNGNYSFKIVLNCVEDYNLIINKQGYKKRENS